MIERHSHHLTRRKMLGTALAAAGLKAIPAKAMAGSDRVLVCIYLLGGHDSNNMLVPTGNYDTYAAARGPLALPKQALLPITSGLDQTQYGFHPALPELQDLFQMGALAVVSNVGHTSRAPIDPNLSFFTPGYAVPKWAANMAEVAEDKRGSLFTGLPNLLPMGDRYTSMALLAPGISASPELRKAASTVAAGADPGVAVAFPMTDLGQQLRQVASLIRAGSSLGFKSQVYTVLMSGFATTQNQLPTQAGLYRELSSAMGAFYAAMSQMGRAQDVTTYTDTEYSRTMVPNGRAGTDPGWGGHQLVMGGSVIGGNVHGVFPDLVPGGRNDADKRGTWIPTSSKDQYAATLAHWFGVSYSDVTIHLPGVQRMGRRTLGFMVTG